ncbi:B-box domain protein 30, partial [Cucurbita argyrosperma subsp. argyrosperma]
MCKGVGQEETQATVQRRRTTEMARAKGGGGDPEPCELCGSRASLYCQADEAYLCQKCDKMVHSANFLALRHVRCLLCNTCQRATRRYLLGASMEVVLPSIVSSSLMERNFQNYHCGSDDYDQNSSQLLQTPCLFL